MPEGHEAAAALMPEEGWAEPCPVHHVRTQRNITFKGLNAAPAPKQELNSALGVLGQVQLFGTCGL